MRTKSFTTMKLLYSFVFIVLVKFVSGAPSSANPLVSYDVVYSWKQLDFDFQSPDKREELIKSNKFVPQNNVIAGIKVHGENVFLSVPRWKSGVPASLVRLPYKYNAGVQASKGVKNGPKLVPYPSWEMNEKGNCSALQNVQSMEIDQYGRMWALDVGRVNIMEENLVENSCAPKLVLINLNTNEVLSTHEFPDTVVDPDTSFLNDIVVGCKTEEDCWAYISDAADAKIVVFDLANNASWFVQHSSMEGNPEASTIQTLGQKYSVNSSVNGIALSPLDTGFSTLFYSPLSSYQLYSVPTEALQKAGESSDNNGTTLADDMVKTVGTKSSQSAGMIIDAGGLLYYGLLNANAVNYWNTTYSSFSDKNQALLVQSDIDLQYPDSLSIDTNGYAFVTTNRLAKFLTNSYDFDTLNFRVVRFFVGLKSYQYAKNDTVEPNLETAAAEPEAEPESEPESEPTAEPETSAAEPEAEPTSEPEPESAAEPESEPTSEPEPENEPEPTGSAEGNDKKQVPITGDDKDLYHNHDHHEEVLSNDLPEQRSLGGNGAGNIEHMQLVALLTIAMIATRLF